MNIRTTFVTGSEINIDTAINSLILIHKFQLYRINETNKSPPIKLPLVTISISSIYSTTNHSIEFIFAYDLTNCPGSAWHFTVHRYNIIIDERSEKLTQMF